jgi:serine/threonine protein kinase
MAEDMCPSREELLDFHAGRLSDEDAKAASEHVANCPDCRASLESLEDLEETLAGQVQDANSGSEGSGGAGAAELEKATDVQAASTDESGKSVNLGKLGDYQLLEKLGQGRRGAVYKAVQTKSERTVALKWLSADRVQGELAVARFERQMKAVCGLNHSNIVQALDARDIEGTSVLVMEYVDGSDLSSVLERCGPLPIVDACEIIRQAASGLQYAHENGLVHRDIRPSNLMLTKKGEVKMLDLGLALLNVDQTDERDMTSIGPGMGAADYMAPEQVFDSHPVDIRADIYSLGCTFYELLTGHAPFTDPKHESHFKKMMAHVQAPFPPIQSKREVTDELTIVVERMVAKEPDQRFATPGELVTALEPFCKGNDLAVLVSDASPEKPAEEKNDRVVAGTVDDVSTAPTGTESSQEVDPTPQPALSSRRWKPWTAAWAIVPLFVIALGVVIWINNTSSEAPNGSDVPVTKSDDVHVEMPRHGKPPTEPPDFSNTDVDRKAAKWVLLNGGALKISTAGKIANPTTVGALPEQPFQVTSVAFTENENLTANGLTHLKGLTGLQYLKLCGLPRLRLTTAEMDILEELPRFTGLSLTEIEIDEGVLGRLKDLKEVFSVTLSSVPLRDKDVEHLAAIPKLSLLNLSSTGITDAGLERLKTAASLDTLDLSNTAITDRGLQHLVDMPQLAVLNLSSTSTTDTGLKHLSQLHWLAELHLAHTPVTNDGLVHLKQMKSLRILNLQKTRVNAAGVAYLQVTLPGCEIMVDPAIQDAVNKRGPRQAPADEAD